MRAGRPDPVPPRSVDARVAAAQSSLPDHAPTSKGREHDLIARAVPGRTRGYLCKREPLTAPVRPANPRDLQRERNAARLADLDRWRR